MRTKIIKQLKKIESEHNVKVLYAIESGSRAWGFASQDSDYDVRFVYVHTRDWYLSIEPKRDVIELPLEDNLDINGWDLTKALTLFRKSNPPLYEWLQSPIVYIKPRASISKLKTLIPDFFSPKACLLHYLSMAENNHKDYLSKPEIKLKKYFYVLRPIFACEWIRTFNTMPPTEFDKLMASQPLAKDLKRTINDLLADKKKGTEQDLKPRIPIIDQYVDQNIVALKSFSLQLAKNDVLPYEPLNQLFRETL